MTRCKTVCSRVAEGNLFRDRRLQNFLKDVHCGVGEGGEPYVCCDKDAVSQEVHCQGILGGKQPEVLVDRGTCGLRKVFSFHIAGGDSTNPGDWPWMARLVYNQNNMKPLVCGGK